MPPACAGGKICSLYYSLKKSTGGAFTFSRDEDKAWLICLAGAIFPRPKRFRS